MKVFCKKGEIEVDLPYSAFNEGVSTNKRIHISTCDGCKLSHTNPDPHQHTVYVTDLLVPKTKNYVGCECETPDEILS